MWGNADSARDVPSHQHGDVALGDRLIDPTDFSDDHKEEARQSEVHTRLKSAAITVGHRAVIMADRFTAVAVEPEVLTDSQSPRSWEESGQKNRAREARVTYSLAEERWGGGGRMMHLEKSVGMQPDRVILDNRDGPLAAHDLASNLSHHASTPHHGSARGMQEKVDELAREVSEAAEVSEVSKAQMKVDTLLKEVTGTSNASLTKAESSPNSSPDPRCLSEKARRTMESFERLDRDGNGQIDQQEFDQAGPNPDHCPLSRSNIENSWIPSHTMLA